MKKTFAFISIFAFSLIFGADQSIAEGGPSCSSVCYTAAYSEKLSDKIFRQPGGPLSGDGCNGLDDQVVAPGSNSKDGEGKFRLSNVVVAGSPRSNQGNSDCQCYYALASTSSRPDSGLHAASPICIHVKENGKKRVVQKKCSKLNLNAKNDEFAMPEGYDESVMKFKFLRQPTCGGKDPKTIRNKKSNTFKDSQFKESETSHRPKKRSGSKNVK